MPTSGLTALGREAVARVGNRLTARRFAAQQRARQPVPHGGVAVWFGAVPRNLYQLQQWLRPLEHLARSVGVFVIVDRPDTGREVAARTSLPVALAQGSAQLEALVENHDVRVVLYLNQVESNYRMLRFTEPWHVQLGHGESDKGGSVSHQHQAFDLTFVGGRAGRDRLSHALREYDGKRRTRLVGRPQLDHSYPGAPDWAPDSGQRVWYAPTWEGDRPSIAYGSLERSGMAIIEALLADPSIRVIYRSHPFTGKDSAAHAAVDRAIKARLRQAGDRHLVDEGPYGWQWRFADACVTDVSAVAYDWLATGKPLVITEPPPCVHRPPAPLLDRLPLLPPEQATAVVSWLRERGLGSDETTEAQRELVDFYFGDVSEGASTRRFEAAVTELLER